MQSAQVVRAVVVSGAVLAATATALAGSLAAASTAAPEPGARQPTLSAAPVSVATASNRGDSSDDVADLPPASVRTIRASSPATSLARKPVARKPVARKPVARKPVARKAARVRPARSAARAAAPSATARRPHAASPLQGAVARIPGYGQRRPAVWVLTSKYGHYGATALGRNTIYISPQVPVKVLDSVVRHEWSHILTVRTFGGVQAAIAGTNRAFGGSGMVGVERAADCMARRLGATWTNYTGCTSPGWQRAAAGLLEGRRP